MIINMETIIEIILIVLVLKLIVGNWQPPVQQSLQALICIGIGSVIALLIEPNMDNLFIGIIVSGFAFYGNELLFGLKSLKTDLENFKGDNKGLYQNKF